MRLTFLWLLAPCLIHILLVFSVKGENEDHAIHIESNEIDQEKNGQLPEHLQTKGKKTVKEAQKENQGDTRSDDTHRENKEKKSTLSKFENEVKDEESKSSHELLAEQRRMFEGLVDDSDDFKLGEHGELEGLFKDSFDPYLEDDLEDHKANIGHYDFDQSEGLSFLIREGTIECFYETIKDVEDKISGAFIVTAADSKIDMTIKDPNGIIVTRRYGEEEDEYQVIDTVLGDYEICFSSINYSGDKLVTHVTHTLKSQHPIEKEHVSHLAEYAAHLDIKLGEFESEQRLLQLRTDRHIKTEQSTNRRVAYYSTFELMTYIVVSILQVVYIKHILNVPRHQRSWA